MSALDDLPNVESFFGVDLKTGSLIIAAIGVVHPMAYGCSCFTPISYLIVTIWILVALFFAASIALFCGIANDDALLCAIWIWYTVIFVVIMLMMMIMLALVFTSRRQRSRVFVAILGMLWYILTIYFVLVVNSHRKTLNKRAGAEAGAAVGAGQTDGATTTGASAPEEISEELKAFRKSGKLNASLNRSASTADTFDCTMVPTTRHRKGLDLQNKKNEAIPKFIPKQ